MQNRMLYLSKRQGRKPAHMLASVIFGKTPLNPKPYQTMKAPVSVASTKPRCPLRQEPVLSNICHLAMSVARTAIDKSLGVRR